MSGAEYERLASAATVDEAAGADSWQIRGVAIGAGDVTTGQSGIETRWPADVLEDTAEALAGDEATVVSGPGGERGPHWEMDEQVPPEQIVGSVTFDFQEGIGLTYGGKIIDEGLAKRIDAGLVDVSPDMWRRLDEQHGDGPAEVAEIVGIPRLTVVERGAGPSASVEVAGGQAALAEYLAEGSVGSDQLADTDVDIPDGVVEGTTMANVAKRRAAGADEGFKERLADHVGGEPSPRGGGGGSPEGDMDDVEEFVLGAMGARHIKTAAAEGLAPSEFVRQLGLSPEKYDTQRELRADLSEKAGSGRRRGA